MAVRAWGEDTPSEPETSKEDDEGDKEEGEVTPPPHSPPREALPSLKEIFHMQTRSQVEHVSQSRLRQRLGRGVAHRHSLASC
jgi:hypothetical protein